MRRAGNYHRAFSIYTLDIPGCPGDYEECNGVCKDTKLDNENCGECYNKCENDDKCCHGVCTWEDNKCCDDGLVCSGLEACCGDKCCPYFETCCPGDTCVDTSLDEENCGSCGNRCPNDYEECWNGQCADMRFSDKDFEKISGNSEQYAVNENKNLFALLTNSQVVRYERQGTGGGTFTGWKTIRGSNNDLINIFAGGCLTLVAQGSDGSLEQYDFSQEQWFKISDNAAEYTVSKDGKIYRVTDGRNSTQIWDDEQSKWKEIWSTGAKKLFPGFDSVLAEHPVSHDIYFYNDLLDDWAKISGPVYKIINPFGGAHKGLFFFTLSNDKNSIKKIWFHKSANKVFGNEIVYNNGPTTNIFHSSHFIYRIDPNDKFRAWRMSLDNKTWEAFTTFGVNNILSDDAC